MTTDERWKGAIHEAGHAVVCHALGRRTKRLWIDAEGLGGQERAYEFSGLTRETCQDLIPDNLAMTYAGEAAEKMFFGTAAIAECDREFIRKLIGLIDPPNPKLPDESLWRAQAVLTERRHALIELARVLLERTCLGEAEVSDILSTVWDGVGLPVDRATDI
jgi:ATP-dependent Zn protease